MGAAMVGSLRLAGLQADYPVVQRTGHGMAVHDPLGQRPTLVRAAITQREERSVRRLEHRDVAARRLNDPRSENRHVIDRAHVDPLAHSAASARVKLAMGLNSCASRPATRSAQGSICAVRWEMTKRS